jgi:hypothetical protein
VIAVRFDGVQLFIELRIKTLARYIFLASVST